MKLPQLAPGQWSIQLFIALDQLANVLVTPLHAGAWADETLSCRAYRMWAAGKPWGKFWMPLIDAMFFWQSKYPGAIGHCHGAYLKEMERYNMPEEMRTLKRKEGE